MFAIKSIIVSGFVWIRHVRLRWKPIGSILSKTTSRRRLSIITSGMGCCCGFLKMTGGVLRRHFVKPLLIGGFADSFRRCVRRLLFFGSEFRFPNSAVRRRSVRRSVTQSSRIRRCYCSFSSHSSSLFSEFQRVSERNSGLCARIVFSSLFVVIIGVLISRIVKSHFLWLKKLRVCKTKKNIYISLRSRSKCAHEQENNDPNK